MSQGSNIGSNLVNGAFVQWAASGGQIFPTIFGLMWLKLLDVIWKKVLEISKNILIKDP